MFKYIEFFFLKHDLIYKRNNKKVFIDRSFKKDYYNNIVCHLGNMTMRTGGIFVGLSDCKTEIDLINFFEKKEKEIKNLTEELKRTENTQRLLDEENIRLINENEKLKLEIKNLEKMLEPYKNKIKELSEENDRLKSKSFYPRAREITDEQIQEIKELRASGLSYRAIEEKTKWSRFTIGKAIKGEYDK